MYHIHIFQLLDHQDQLIPNMTPLTLVFKASTLLAAIFVLFLSGPRLLNPAFAMCMS